MAESARIRILTDSVSDIHKSFVDQYNIGIIPIHITLNDKQILDDGTLDRDWFYSQLATISSKPKTADPSSEEFIRAFRKLTAEGAEVIIGLFASASLSSIFNQATIAVRDFDAVAIHLIDTQQISMGFGWIVVSVAEALQTGATVEDITQLVSELRNRTYVFSVLDSIAYLRNSGRVGWTAAYVGDMLRIKPVISFFRGEVRLVRKVRSRLRAFEHVVTLMKSRGPFERLAILHSNADKVLISRFKELLAPYIQSLRVPLVKIGSVFASHVGPGCLGVACVGTGDRGP